MSQFSYARYVAREKRKEALRTAGLYAAVGLAAAYLLWRLFNS